MYKSFLSFYVLVVLSINSYSFDEIEPNHVLRSNMTHHYIITPQSANSLDEIFSNGMLYGHLRTNYFRWNYKDSAMKENNNKAFGIGGSLLYKTAPYKGSISLTTGFYYSNSPFKALRVSDDKVGIVRSGKDTFSRYDVKENGSWEMMVLAQAYVEYVCAKSKLRYGRQLFESTLVASNDNKMIPNAFEGFSFESKDIQKTTIKFAYFTKQKLKDHTTFHDVMTYKDSSAEAWGNLDGGAAHKGLSYDNFRFLGKKVDHKLVVFSLNNRSIDKLKLDFSYTAVPEVLSLITAESSYIVNLGDGYALSSAIRYIQQFDDGGGDVGGSSIHGALAIDKNPTSNLGYKDRYSLDSNAWMGKLVLSKSAFRILFGYSQIADKADLVTPWRGFPTGEYTRAMGQINWLAATKTYATSIKYDFDKAHMLRGFTTIAGYTIQDFDETKQKADVQADSKVFSIDFIKQVTPQLDIKVRFADVASRKRIYGSQAGKDVDSYMEYRFEMNYLF